MSRRSRIYLPLLFGLLLFGAFQLASGRTDVPPKIQNWLLFATAIPLILFAVRAVDFLFFEMLSRRRAVRAPTLLREILAVALYFVAFGWAISAIFHYSVTGLLFTGTVLAAVLGLALQETLGNVFAGIALHLEDSFDVGDVIRSGDFIGVVEAMRWRGTRIRTFNNDIVILPNSLLARERVEIYPRNNLNARVLQISIDYNIPPAAAIAVLVQATSNVEGVARESPVIARVGGFGDSGVTYEVKYFTHDYSQRDRIDSEIRKAIWYALRRNHMPIPYQIWQSMPYVRPLERHEITREELVEELQQVDILSPLSAHAREDIAAAAHVHQYSKGETIIRRGSEGNSMFIIHEGSVAIRIDDREVARLGAGSVVGEMALLTGETRTADVVAVTDVLAAEIGKAALQPILQEHPELATAISAKVAARQDSLASLQDISRGDQEQSVLARIRSYFGL